MSVDELVGINQAIVASIPPEEMAIGLSFMLPAMNIDDRTEMLGGMKAGAPPEVFAGVWGLVRFGAPEPDDYTALAARWVSPRPETSVMRATNAPARAYVARLDAAHGTSTGKTWNIPGCSCASVSHAGGAQTIDEMRGSGRGRSRRRRTR